MVCSCSWENPKRHQRLGHLDFNKIKHLFRTWVLSNTAANRQLHTAASKLKGSPKCAACLFGKQTVRKAPGSTTSVIKDIAGVLRGGNLHPGQEVSRGIWAKVERLDVTGTTNAALPLDRLEETDVDLLFLLGEVMISRNSSEIEAWLRHKVGRVTWRRRMGLIQRWCIKEDGIQQRSKTKITEMNSLLRKAFLNIKSCITQSISIFTPQRLPGRNHFANVSWFDDEDHQT